MLARIGELIATEEENHLNSTAGEHQGLPGETEPAPHFHAGLTPGSTPAPGSLPQAAAKINHQATGIRAAESKGVVK
jgi:hypothetical protein